MPRAYVMFVDNDMLIEVDGLQDSSDDSYLNAATVTALLKDENDVNVTGQLMPVSLSYVAGSNGKYQGIFDSVVDRIAGDCGTIEITAAEGTLDAFWTLSYRVKKRVS